MDWRMVIAALACLAGPAAAQAPADSAPAAETPADVPEADPGAQPDAGTGPAAEAPAPQLVWMGTGNVAGVYFPVGVALCRLVNQHRPATGLRCAATPSAGSVENVGGLGDGRFQLAIVQSDSQADALAGTGAFAAAGAMPDLRAVMGLYDEPLAIVVRPDAAIAAVPDLAGKRVSLGEDGSGTRVVAEAVLTAFGIDPAGFADVAAVTPDRLGQALCDGRIDAFLYAVGQPALPILEATAGCGATFVAVAGPEAERVLAAQPAMIASEIPGGLYAGTGAAVPTVGVKATLVTRAAEPDASIANVVGAVLDDLETLRGLDPVLAGLEPEAMASGGLTAPLHPAAAAIYRDRGLLPE